MVEQIPAEAIGQPETKPRVDRRGYVVIGVLMVAGYSLAAFLQKDGDASLGWLAVPLAIPAAVGWHFLSPDLSARRNRPTPAYEELTLDEAEARFAPRQRRKAIASSVAGVAGRPRMR